MEIKDAYFLDGGFCCCLFELRSFYVVLDVLKLDMETRLALGSKRSFCLIFLNAGIKCVCHRTCLCFIVFKHKCSWVWWHITVIPITQEVKVGLLC